MLADAEDQTSRRQRLRRIVLVFAPAALAVVLATLGTVSARADTAAPAGLVRSIMDAAMVIGYGMLFVLAPLYLSVTPVLRASAAAIAAVAGPIGMPILLGDGWKLWHRGVVLAACLLIIAARRAQPEPLPLRRRGRRR
jgi:hypothetical protein